MVRLPLDRPQELLPRGCIVAEPRLQERLDVANDRSERGAELVRGDVEELGLASVQLSELLHGLPLLPKQSSLGRTAGQGSAWEDSPS